MSYIKITKVPYWLAKDKDIPNKPVLGRIGRKTEKAINVIQDSTDFMVEQNKDMWFPKKSINYEEITFEVFCKEMQKIHDIDVLKYRDYLLTRKNNRDIDREKEILNEAYSQIKSDDWEVITHIAKKINSKFDVQGLNQYRKPILSFESVDYEWWMRLEGIQELYLMKSYVDGIYDKDKNDQIRMLKYFLHKSDRNTTSRGMFPDKAIEKILEG